jgi:hypothetical protein
MHLPVFSVSETARDSVAVFQSVISRYVVPMLKFGCWESLKIQLSVFMAAAPGGIQTPNL